jgi:hypothetical protein
MTIIMKLIEKKRINRLLIMFLLAGLSMVSVSALSTAATPKIGDSYGGGVIFYVDGTSQHGLIAAKSDATGRSNDKAEGVFDWYSAKEAANAFLDSYGDWFLPNKEQLRQLYKNRSAVGGFAESVYWSSSEGDEKSAWAQSFGSGDQLVGKKTNGSHVRAVRLF